jgi:hypothetical protein
MITKVNNTVLDLENPTVDGLDMGGNVISNHGSPTFSGDVANKLYVDTIAGAGPSGFLPLSGGTMDLGANIGMNTGRIIGLSTPVSGGDAANKGYVDTEIVLAITGFGSQQVVHTPMTAALSIPSSAVVINDDIPQNTDGTEITALNTTITPVSATNLLKIEFDVIWAHSGDNTGILFFIVQDAIADAVVSTWEMQIGVNFFNNTHFTWYTLAGSTVARTYKLRIADLGSVGTTTINGATGTRRFGGTLVSHMTITEIAPAPVP